MTGHFLSIFQKRIALGVIIFVFAAVVGAVTWASAIYWKETLHATEVLIPNGKAENVPFSYGSWGALENASFFEVIEQRFVAEKISFIEADLSAMTLRVYKEGMMVKEVPIVSKGRVGSWWETPAGLYKVETKEKSHYSSFGHVYMPWSMAFQGNFFIHGWPHHEDGSPVPEGYSGGCIRLADEDARDVFSLSTVGMPVLVFEKPFRKELSDGAPPYAFKGPAASSTSYLAADLENNFVFAQKSPNESRSIASITKLMTALVAAEYINVEKEVTITTGMMATTSIPRIKPGDRHAVIDLLSLLLMESSNEAATAIAAPLGRIRFVQLMNAKAAAIGMKQSSFVDTSGVHADDLSTAQDLFMLAKYLYYNRSFLLHMSMGKERRDAYGSSAFRNLQNFNEIKEIPEMIGGKIGLSSAAGETRLAIVELKIDGEKRPIAIIVLGSDDSKRDTMAILEHIRSNYEKKAAGSNEGL